MVSNMFYVHPYLGKIPILTNMFFQMGWFNHQPDNVFFGKTIWHHLTNDLWTERDFLWGFYLAGGFRYIFIVKPKIGDMIQFDEHICSNGLTSTNQL